MRAASTLAFETGCGFPLQDATHPLLRGSEEGPCDFAAVATGPLEAFAAHTHRVRMTLRYAHLGDREIEAEAERIGQEIGGLMDI